jgi:hypothetical protein
VIEPLEVPEPKCIKKANNLVRDARMAVLVGLIPILGLVFILRLVQWYLLKEEVLDLETSNVENYDNIAQEYRSALPRLWFAVLFWPVLIGLLTAYIAATG